MDVSNVLGLYVPSHQRCAIHSELMGSVSSLGLQALNTPLHLASAAGHALVSHEDVGSLL